MTWLTTTSPSAPTKTVSGTNPSRTLETCETSNPNIRSRKMVSLKTDVYRILGGERPLDCPDTTNGEHAPGVTSASTNAKRNGLG